VSIKRLWIVDIDQVEQIKENTTEALDNDNYWLLTKNIPISFDLEIKKTKSNESLYFIDNKNSQTAIQSWPNLLKGLLQELSPKAIYLDCPHPFFIQTLNSLLTTSSIIHVLFSNPENMDLESQHFCSSQIMWHCFNLEFINYLLENGVSPLNIATNSKHDLDWILNGESSYAQFSQFQNKISAWIQTHAKQFEQIGNIQVNEKTETTAHHINATVEHLYMLPAKKATSDGPLEIEKPHSIYYFFNSGSPKWKETLSQFSRHFENQSPVALVLIPISSQNNIQSIEQFYQEVEVWFESQESASENLPEIILLDPEDFSGWSDLQNQGLLYLDASLSIESSVQLVLLALSYNLRLFSDFQELNLLFDQIFTNILNFNDYPQEFTNWQNALSSARLYEKNPQAYFLWNRFVIENLVKLGSLSAIA
jgi:hypothetical protein